MELTLLQAIEGALDSIGTVYLLVAPQGTTLPYIIVTPLPAPLVRYFGGRLEYIQIQIDQYYKWTGAMSTAWTDHESIITALDTVALGGIAMKQLTTPLVTVEDGKVLRLMSQWEWHGDRS